MGSGGKKRVCRGRYTAELPMMHDLEGDTPCSVAAGVNHKEVPLLAERCGGKGAAGGLTWRGRWPSQLFLGVSHVTRGGGGDRLTFEFAGEKQNRNPFFFIRYGAHSSQSRPRQGTTAAAVSCLFLSAPRVGAAC